jgi:DNA-directed RNA polymerase specialized sigma24 family protein
VGVNPSSRPAFGHWPPVPPSVQEQLLRDLAAGRPGALAELYDGYAERLLDFASSVVGSGPSMAEVVHDALIDASRRAPRLRNHRGLQSWLYAAVRRRLVDRRSGPALWAAPSESVRASLESAFGGLDMDDREVLLLTVRHGLDPATLAAALGIGVPASTARVDRVLAEATGRLAGSGLTPEGLLVGYAPPTPPSGLRDWVLHTGSDPELAPYRANIIARGGGLTTEGIPRQPDTPSPAVRRSRTATLRALAGSGAMIVAMATAATVATVVALLPPVLRAPATGDPTPELHRVGFTRPSPSTPTVPRPIGIEAVPIPSDRPRPSPVATLHPEGAGATILHLPEATVAVAPEDLVSAVSSAVQGAAGEIPAVP